MEFMNETLYDISYWTYATYFFLLLSGIFSTIAIRKSTSEIVNSGVSETLKGTRDQLINPLLTLYTFLISNYKPVHDEFLSEIRSYLSMHELSSKAVKGVITIGGSKIQVSSLMETSRETSKNIASLTNKINSQISSVEKLIADCKNDSVKEQFEKYKTMYPTIKDNRTKPVHNKMTYNDYRSELKEFDKLLDDNIDEISLLKKTI